MKRCVTRVYGLLPGPLLQRRRGNGGVAALVVEVVPRTSTLQRYPAQSLLIGATESYPCGCLSNTAPARQFDSAHMRIAEAVPSIVGSLET
jgi:hypothetical protein